MNVLVKCFVYSSLFSLIMSSAHAEETQMQYKQQKLPDGSTQTEYSSADGTKLKQTQHPDGTIETDAIDAQGNETITTQHPNGNVEVKTKGKSTS